MSTHVQVFVSYTSILDSLGTCTCGIAGSYGSSMFKLFRKLFPKGLLLATVFWWGADGDPCWVMTAL